MACGGGRVVGIGWYEMDIVVATSPELRKKRAGSVGVQEKEAVESLQLGFWLVCSLHLFLLYSGLLLKIFYSGLFVQLSMLWKMEGCRFLWLWQREGLLVLRKRIPISALFLVRLLSLVSFLSTILFVFIAFYK